MQIEKQPGYITGIKCDLCGSEHTGDFIYYSLDVREVVVKANARTFMIDNLPIIFSLDYCQDCISNLQKSVVDNYAPTSVGVNCDICAAKLRGDFTYYYVNITSVAVRMSQGVIKCAMCKQPLTQQKSCACEKPHPIRIASLDINDKLLQVIVCPDDYVAMTKAHAALRQRS